MTPAAHAAALISKIRDRNAVVAILGMGYVGLPLMLRFSEVGFQVIGVDIDPAKVDRLNRGESYIKHIKPDVIAAARRGGFTATTDEELKPRIESTGLKIGQEVFLVFSPEREDPANPEYVTKTIPKVCGGTTPACLDVGTPLYGAIIDRVVPVSSTRTAEMTKLLECQPSLRTRLARENNARGQARAGLLGFPAEPRMKVLVTGRRPRRHAPLRVVARHG